MNNISYYSSEKKYKTAAVYPQSENELELVRFQNDLGICLKLDETLDIKNPRFYVCRGEGFLQLNRSNFFSVKISDQVIPMLRYCSNVEVVISHGDDNSVNSVFASVEHVLRVPEYVKHDMTRPAEDADRKNCSGEDQSPDEDEEPTFPHTPPAEVFFGWLFLEDDADIVMECGKGVKNLTLVHDGGTLMLVSFFDEPARDWLADEEEINDEPALWFSDQSHRPSPLYTLKLAIEYLKSHGIVNVVPLTILSDHVNIINTPYIADVWREIGITVCYCFRNEDDIAPFEETIGVLKKAHPEWQEWNEEDLGKIQKLLHDFQESRG